jgi:hypothetical protein
MLTSERHTVEAEDFTDFARGRGWGDGLPLVPPTEERVAAAIEASLRPADTCLAVLPPSGAACTVEKLAINAVLAGASPSAMPLLCAAVEALAAPAFDLAAVNTSSHSVVPMLVVNGAVRSDAGIPWDAGCFGGVASAAPAVGRTLRLLMRNVAGQLIGSTSESVFGQPARVTGVVVGEWEERSPWAPLAERRGVAGSAVTAFGSMGTMNIIDNAAESGAMLLEVIGKSLAYMGANGFPASQPSSQVAVALNPIWAERIGAELPDMADVEQAIWGSAALPLEHWPLPHQKALELAGRVDRGRVHLVPSPRDVLVFVCGGVAGPHAFGLHGALPNFAVTKPVRERTER